MTSDTRGTNSPGDIDWEALARYAAGEADPVEAERMERWLVDHPEHEASLSVLLTAIGRLRASGSADVSAADTASALQAVKSRGKCGEAKVVAIPPRRRLHRWSVAQLAIAAGLLIALSGLGLRYLGSRSAANVASTPETTNSRTYTSRIGASDSVVLSDGTRVALAPGSALIVAAGYGQTNRTVTLRGEAFFVAVHDTTHAFTVMVDGAVVRDVGTSFSVRADRPNTVRVTVASGEVVLRATSDSGAGTSLHASDVGVIESATAGRVRVRNSSAPPPTGEAGQIVFDEATMVEVAEVLHRWFGVDVAVDSSVARRHVTVTLSHPSPAQAVDVIAQAVGATADWRNTSVAFHSAVPPTRQR
jgi:transmembrane sensor